MNLIVFLSIILAFTSCAPAIVTNQQCAYVPQTQGSNHSNSKYVVIPNGKLQFIWPIKGEVVDSFGKNLNYISNKGINIKVKSGESIVASEAGKVIYANRIKGWGKILILQHSGDFYSVYANLEDIFIREGFVIKKGETIGKVASLGSKGETILHFEIRKRYCAENPLSYLKYN
ncbi:MAG: peptidoglycan DD-metalloendopeptidase family protein [Candidatus Omnitrophota bacterium]|jgi:septal ring factor EnvC (AmiA/AmiB activator)